MPVTEQPKMTLAQWRTEAEKRFGSDPMKWKFVCPACGHVASVQDWKDAGAPENAVAFSCVGRWSGAKLEMLDDPDKSGPCNYAGGGLIGLNPVRVALLDSDKFIDVFAFADPEVANDAKTEG